MKKLICTALASLMLLSAAGCGKISPDIETAATASAAEQILIDRLGEVPENVVLGDAAVAAEYGIDMTNFESDGYVIRTVGDSTLVFGKTDDGLERAVYAYTASVKKGTADELNVTYHEGYRVERLTIAGRDISEYTVYYPETANENMKFAADELVRLIEMATGVRLPVVVGVPASPAIELRHTDDPALGNDGYRYEVTENGVILEGAVRRGCMYGVWYFLQWELGWDSLGRVDNTFLVVDDSYLNEADHIDIPVGVTRSEAPAFPEMVRVYNHPHSFKTDIRFPNNAQNSYGFIPMACHGMQTYKFCDYDINLWEEQICFSSEERYEECFTNVEKYIQSNLDAGQMIGRELQYIDLSGGDNDNYCFCETCFEVFFEEGKSVAGTVIRFVNRLSEEMNEKYPGLVYLIFAYCGSNQPPAVTVPNDLTYVTYCFGGCSSHTLDGKDCDDTLLNAGVKANEHAGWFEGWCDLTDNIYVWHYTTGTALQAYTVIDNIYDDYQYLFSHNVKGFMLETENYGDFGIKRIENQLAFELIWDPDMTREEFWARYYELLEAEFGPGWALIEEYIRSWEASQDMVGCWYSSGWYHAGCEDYRYSTYYYREGFDQYCELMEGALAMAETAEQINRINRLYATILYMGCYSSYYFAYNDGDTERMQVLSDRYDRCMEMVRSFGFDPESLPTIGEGSNGYLPFNVHYSPTIEEAAWSDWVDWYDDITHDPLPEDAPVIKK